jgi:hypothetical protein
MREKLQALPGNRTQHLWGNSRLRIPLNNLGRWVCILMKFGILRVSPTQTKQFISPFHSFAISRKFTRAILEHQIFLFTQIRTTWKVLVSCREGREHNKNKFHVLGRLYMKTCSKQKEIFVRHTPSTEIRVRLQLRP